MKFYATFLLLFVVTVGHAQSNEKPITEFSRKDANTVMFIDVHTMEEYGAGHVENAINADWLKATYWRLLASYLHARTRWC